MATIKRNLPLNDNYKIIDSYYSSLIEGGGCTCDNCNKSISNIAVIKNDVGKVFNVGLDCAESLSNLSGLHSISVAFAESKGIRAKINKAKKVGAKIESELLPNGEIVINAANFRIYQKQEFVTKYLPEIVPTVINANKIGFKPQQLEVVSNYKGIEGKKELLSVLPCNVSIGSFTAKLYTKEGLKMDGTPNGSTLLCCSIDNKETSCYMLNDFNCRINWLHNSILLENYTNQVN